MAVTPIDQIPPVVRGVDSLWFDPQLINAANSIQISQVFLPASVPTLLARPSGSRWMLGVTQPPSGSIIEIAPWGDVSAYPFVNLTVNGPDVWLKLWDFGPIIMSSWYGNSQSDITVRVTEIIRN